MKKILTVLSLVGNLFVMAASLMFLWGWFISPAFGVKPISYGISLGLILVASLFITTSTSMPLARIERMLAKDSVVDSFEEQKSHSLRIFFVSLILTMLGFVIHILS